ncbi:radical SAM protein [Actinomadura fulvescens]|uniref:Lysine-2,3-aminomutase-like protein n=1 Tax=Actinomadura fulvescens TaxID=46160 RepID=A0ABP6D3W8_9ACTN
MAGLIRGEFQEIISPFLKEKMAEVAATSGYGAPEYKALALQYQRDPQEVVVLRHQSSRHYEAVMAPGADGPQPQDGPHLRGVERLYRRTLLVEPTIRCAAHCRWCIRANYEVADLSPTELESVARYAGSPALRSDITEVLVTGGDPLVTPKLLRLLVDELKAHAPNVTTIRIGTRMPFQAPSRVNDTFLAIIRDADPIRVEIGLHANHPVEFWPETTDALNAIRDAGATLYNQHPVLAGVNDDGDTLAELYEALRAHRIEPHYMFHAAPMRGMEHHRTTVDELLELHRTLTTSGRLSGRTKPKPALLTDIGKVVLTEGAVIGRDDEGKRLLLRTAYSVEDRRRWNPTWTLPPSAVIGADGRMAVWYQDRKEKPDPSPA